MLSSFEITKDLQIKHFRDYHILLNQLKQKNANSASQWILVINFNALVNGS